MSFHGGLAQHSLNLMWNYYEMSGSSRLWRTYSQSIQSDYPDICSLFGTKSSSEIIPEIAVYIPKSIIISSNSADSLTHIPDGSVDAITTDPPYYDTIPYAELLDFFYVWLRRILLDVLPDLFWSELTDKEREAVANLGRFRNMGISPKDLAYQDYEAKMAMAFAEYYRVLRDDGVMTVQFNHKDSGAWDVLVKSLIDAGFEITTSWAVSTGQLALAVGGFNVADLAKTYKLLDSTSGTCKFLTPQQRHKKRAFSLVEEEFSARYLINALHAIITLYLEEQEIEPVLRFLKTTGLLGNDLFMRSWDVALKVIPRIGDEKKRIPEEKALADLWLAMDEIKAKVVYIQPELAFEGQQSLDFGVVENE